MHGHGQVLDPYTTLQLVFGEEWIYIPGRACRKLLVQYHSVVAEGRWRVVPHAWEYHMFPLSQPSHADHPVSLFLCNLKQVYSMCYTQQVVDSTDQIKYKYCCWVYLQVREIRIYPSVESESFRARIMKIRKMTHEIRIRSPRTKQAITRPLLTGTFPLTVSQVESSILLYPSSSKKSVWECYSKFALPQKNCACTIISKILTPTY